MVAGRTASTEEGTLCFMMRPCVGNMASPGACDPDAVLLVKAAGAVSEPPGNQMIRLLVA